MRVLMLAPFMKLGYGVSEAIAALARNLEPIGIMTTVACLEHDNHYYDIDVRTVRPNREAVLDLTARIRAGAVVAHGSPFFEVLPTLSGQVRTVAYEYGDPTPEMFTSDATERRRIADAKRVAVYPRVDEVATISEFVRHDIGWPEAHVVRLGVEHVPDLGTKPLIPPPDALQPLRVGTLMRLGEGEAHYKGNDLLLEIQRAALGLGDDRIRFEVMGRGKDADAVRFRELGFGVHLNATDDERSAFLRDIDVFVSPSLWEGTNLPLVEAAALGTPALAFDTGAHPEFTPLLFSNVADMVAQIQAYERSRTGLLREHGALSYRYVHRAMSWDVAAIRFGALLRGTHNRPPQRRPLKVRVRTKTHKLRRSVTEHGLESTSRQALGMLANKVGLRK